MDKNFDLIMSVLNSSQKDSSARNFLHRMWEFYKAHRLFVNFALLAIFFFANCFAYWVTYIVFPLLAVMMLFDSLENGLSYIMFSLPFCTISPFASMVIYLCSIALYAIKFYIIYFVKDKGKPSWTVLFFATLFVVYALLPIGPYSINTLFKLAISLIIYIALFALSRKWKTFRFCFNLRILACSILLSAVFGALIFVSPYLQTIIPVPVEGSLYRFQALLTNTNVFAMLCELVLAFLAYQSIKSKKGLLNFLLFLCVALVGFFTFSKLFYITLAVTTVMYFVGMMFVNWKKTLLAASITLLVAGIVAAIVYSQKPEFFQKIIARFGSFTGSLDENMNGFTTSRWSLWKGTFAYWSAHPYVFFVGRGLGASQVPGLVYSAHNLYISSIDQLGLIGSILFVLPSFLLLRDLLKDKQLKVSRAIIIPFAALAIIFMAEDLLFYIFPF